MLALAMQRWNLHRRVALRTLKIMGPKTGSMIGGFMIATGMLSMWVSSTATAVMMLPIGMSVLILVSQAMPGLGKQVKNEQGEIIVKSNFATALMLGIAYSASIASLSTIIATPPNVLLVGYLEENFDITIGFAQWMMVGLPLAIIFLFLAWIILTKVLFKPEFDEVPGGRELIQKELDALGPVSSGEKRVLGVFLFAALSWIFVPFIFENPPITDSGIAMIVAILLFTIPPGAARGVRLLDWQSAVAMPWGVLLLFGGGLALSAQFTQSGLTDWIGDVAQGIGGLPVVLIIFLTTGAILMRTELTSNTATAATFIPVAGGIAVGIGIDPLLLTLAVTFAATCSFMLPVATPPNAIAFGSGYVTIGQMIKGGLALNIVSLFLVTGGVVTLAAWVFGLAI